MAPFLRSVAGRGLTFTHVFDDALRELLAALDAAGVLDETLVVVYGDHSEHRGLDLAWVERNAGVQRFPDARSRPAADCDAIRARAREELEVSWLVTRRGLGPGLAGR